MEKFEFVAGTINFSTLIVISSADIEQVLIGVGHGNLVPYCWCLVAVK